MRALDELSTTEDPVATTAHSAGASGQTFQILIVCTANICRSPLAERLLRAALAAAPEAELPSFVVASAGIRGWAGREMDPAAAAELTRLGGDSDGFRARDLRVADCGSADLILTAAGEHRRWVLQECPHALRRTFTLLEFAHLVTDVERVRRVAGDPSALVRAASSARGTSSLDNYDIGDPYGKSQQVHRSVANRISAAVDKVAGSLTGDPGPVRDGWFISGG
jgi:protein-tyrosine phosphatase